MNIVEKMYFFSFQISFQISLSPVSKYWHGIQLELAIPGINPQKRSTLPVQLLYVERNPFQLLKVPPINML